VASNGIVQPKTWNPNGLAAVANLPCCLTFFLTLLLTAGKHSVQKPGQLTSVERAGRYTRSEGREVAQGPLRW
jgi:hypothetical protein